MKSKFLSRLTARLPQGFLGPVAVLCTGTFFAQLLPVLLSPVLTRLLGTADFGGYALFLSTVNILSQLVCLKYDLAIAAAKSPLEAAHLFQLSLVISVLFSTGLCLLFPFAPFFAQLIGTTDYGWLFLTPLSTLFTGLYTALCNYNIKLEHFSDVTKANIIKAVAMVGIQLLGGFLGLGSYALCFGQIISYLVGNTALLKNVLPHLRGYWLKLRELRRVAKEHNGFAKYTTIGSFANSCVFNCISYFISAFYSPQVLGCYSLVNRVLATPLSIVSGAMGQVFLQRATDKNDDHLHTHRVFTKVSSMLFVFSLPIFLLLYLFAPPLFSVVFGAEWADGAIYLRILIPLFAARFVVSPVSTAALAKGHQLGTMVWQICLLLVTCLPAVFANFQPLSIENFLLLISLSLTVGYLIFWIYCKHVLKRNGGESPRNAQS